MAKKKKILKCTEDKCFHIDYCNNLKKCPDFKKVIECQYYRKKGGSKKLNITREGQERQYENWNFSSQRGKSRGYYGRS